jgi:hypothetical protein
MSNVRVMFRLIHKVDYHWPGFKSEQPEMGYPVLQPVLQYGQTLPARWQVSFNMSTSTQHSCGDDMFNRLGWFQVQSWFVHGGAVTAPAIEVSPGDSITSFMVFDVDTQTWTVSGTNLRTQESSVLVITKVQPVPWIPCHTSHPIILSHSE